jgi:hypothetical protein
MSKGRWGKRRLNRVSWVRNPLGEFFVFGFIGTGKDETVTTLAYRATKPAIMKVYHKYQQHIGELMNDVPVDRR